MRLRSSCVLPLVAMAALALGVTGCRGKANAPSVAKNTPRQYSVRGVVLSTNPANGEVMLKHEAIPGFMPAMTMPYPLENPSILSSLHPGDVITATLLVDNGPDGPTNPRLTNIDVIAEARPNYKPTVTDHVPARGDEVPDFTLLNQSGREIDLKQFHGQVVLMTFIYTRCPFSDFCPRMSHNFATIDHTLKSDPALYQDTHLLSVSFDPTYDTPKVLRSYGAGYTGNDTQAAFKHWEFAAPSVAELPKMEQWFDVGVTQQSNGLIQHSLSTVVIGKDGKIVSFYPTNDWTIAQVLADIHSAASS